MLLVLCAYVKASDLLLTLFERITPCYPFSSLPHPHQCRYYYGSPNINYLLLKNNYTSYAEAENSFNNTALLEYYNSSHTIRDECVVNYCEKFDDQFALTGTYPRRGSAGHCCRYFTFLRTATVDKQGRANSHAANYGTVQADPTRDSTFEDHFNYYSYEPYPSPEPYSRNNFPRPSPEPRARGRNATKTVEDVLVTALEANPAHCVADEKLLAGLEPHWSGFVDWAAEYYHDLFYTSSHSMHAHHINFKVQRFELGPDFLSLSTSDGDAITINKRKFVYFKPRGADRQLPLRVDDNIEVLLPDITSQQRVFAQKVYGRRLDELEGMGEFDELGELDELYEATDADGKGRVLAGSCHPYHGCPKKVREPNTALSVEVDYGRRLQQNNRRMMGNNGRFTPSRRQSRRPSPPKPPLLPTPYEPSQAFAYYIVADRPQAWPQCPRRFISANQACDAMDLWEGAGSHQRIQLTPVPGKARTFYLNVVGCNKYVSYSTSCRSMAVTMDSIAGANEEFTFVVRLQSCSLRCCTKHRCLGLRTR